MLCDPLQPQNAVEDGSDQTVQEATEAWPGLWQKINEWQSVVRNRWVLQADAGTLPRPGADAKIGAARGRNFLLIQSVVKHFRKIHPLSSTQAQRDVRNRLLEDDADQVLEYPPSAQVFGSTEEHPDDRHRTQKLAKLIAH